MSAVTLREVCGQDGRVEIDVYVDGKIRSVVTHPCSGAKWFVHRMDSKSSRGIRCRSKMVAIDKAIK